MDDKRLAEIKQHRNQFPKELKWSKCYEMEYVDELLREIEAARERLDTCYNDIANACRNEDGLNPLFGEDTLEMIEATIGQTENIKWWNDPHTPTT